MRVLLLGRRGGSAGAVLLPRTACRRARLLRVPPGTDPGLVRCELRAAGSRREVRRGSHQDKGAAWLSPRDRDKLGQEQVSEVPPHRQGATASRLQELIHARPTDLVG